MNELIYKTETDSQIYRTNLKLPGGRVGRKDSYRMCGWRVHTAIIKMDSKQGPAI